MDISILLYMLVGFLAQTIDGALGMAYGVSSNTFLLSVGIPPAAASASVHMAEVVTTGISGFAHWRLGNVDWKLVKRLLFPGVIGGVAGAYLLTAIDGDAIKPWIAAYLLIMGGVIIYKAFTSQPRNKPDEYHGPNISWLGLFGGFCDAIGGGGWGPVVTSTLVARGKYPRMTIGSVNFDARSLHENAEAVAKSSPTLRGFNAGGMAKKTDLAEYHPGAIKYYKEKGLWPPK